MRPDEYWKNFNLGTELDISGRFLFNGLQAFHEMKHFAAEEDAFEFLYSVAVGVERLLKIAIILTEHDTAADQESFEKSLITHSHQDLALRLREPQGLKFPARENEFIAILGRFYTSQRYGRYSLKSVFVPTQERDELVKFLEKHLEIKIDTSGWLTVTRNERKHRKFIGKVVSKIVNPVHKIIEEEARRLNIYTYEIDCQSKASKIFLSKKFDFEDEDILQAELMAYFLSSEARGPNAQLIRDLIKPLSFDPALEGEYLAALRSDRKKIAVLDELESHYEDVTNFKERRDLLEASMSENLTYGEEVEDEGIEDFEIDNSEDEDAK
ncbi:hypothetical protein JMK10_00330 [Rhodovulum sulfidophilum]|uniref:hypothetical protein n=1 Tax=Rhodovulum sulfidophilum TaxID=35806 RepID=UPI001920F2C5|nr:hypothetical protein [Rhodovulum sulfidophilum]MBL3575583.1 hypothetical protein [Rhodovulum sulfidophilum]MCE8431788.1 hypothetical protein [Rhodovulum sulfidophilum]MCF4115308.1 hypothetical protein [Rhodovulum sulfidophilum]